MRDRCTVSPERLIFWWISPAWTEHPYNRAEEEAAGLSRAYLFRYGAEELINWSNDENGQYEWVVLRRQQRRQPKVESPEIVEETYWYYFDKQEYRVYRREQREQESHIELVSQGDHGLAQFKPRSAIHDASKRRACG